MQHYAYPLFLIVLALFPDKAASQQLRDPGWSDPAFATYLSALDTRSGTDRTSISTGVVDAEGERVVFSLPVLGFASIERAEADRSGIGNVPFDPAALGRGISSWPECANTEPQIVTIPSKPDESAGAPVGSWYVRSFDYGCMTILVEGDQNPIPEGFGTPVTPPSGTIEITWFDENSGIVMDETGRTLGRGHPLLSDELVARGTPTVKVALGALIYGMEVYCIDPSTVPFCNNGSALRDLAQRLTVVGGEPQ